MLNNDNVKNYTETDGMPDENVASITIDKKWNCLVYNSQRPIFI